MTNQIRSSLDWQLTQTALEAPLHKMKKYTHEMWNISHNIGLMVRELSKEEKEEVLLELLNKLKSITYLKDIKIETCTNNI